MTMIRLLVMLAAAAATAAPVAAATCDLEPGREAKVTRIIDSETVEIESGETVRLVGALAPHAPAWWKSEEPWKASVHAKAALERLLGGRSVHLAFSGRERDRHNRFLAHLFIIDELELIWVQGRLVAEGHARAYSLPGNRACIRALQEREARARSARSGFWSGTSYAPVDASQTEKLSKRRFDFQIVEGQVVSVGVTRGWTFLNFGKDYKTDFTVAIRAGDRRHFKGSDIELENLEGERLRIRGWIESWNGPVIKATHPEQIELLEPGAKEAAPEKQNPAPSPAPGSVKL